MPAVRAALAGAGQAVLQAPPGAGKTTVVPLRLLDEPWLAGGRIVMLEPRRLATRAAARRMASLLGEEVGGTVGYRTRDERRSGPATRVEVVTEGILTRRLQRDPTLPGVGLVIFDEFHERNLHADLALALTLDARPALRPDLRLLVMSATIDTARISALLGGAPVIISEGRAWPVDIRFTPPAPRAAEGRVQGTAGPAAPARFAGCAGGHRSRATGPAGADRGRPRVPSRRRGHPPGRVGTDGAGVGAARRSRRPAALRRAAGRRPGCRAGAVTPGAAAGGPRHRHRRDQPDRRRGARGRRRGLAPHAALRPPQRAHPTGDGGDHQGVGRSAGRPGRAHRTGCGLPPVVEAGARRPPSVPRSGDRHRRPGRPGPRAGGVGRPGPATLPFLDPPPARALEEGRRLLTFLGALDADGRPDRRPDGPWPICPSIPAWPAWSSAPWPPAGAARPAPWPPCSRSATSSGAGPTRSRPTSPSACGCSSTATPATRRPTAAPWPRPAAGPRSWPAGSGIPAPGPDDALDPGPVLALAYPDRIAQARGGARFRLRGGGGAWLAAGEPLAGEAFLVAADLDAAGRGSAAAGKDSRIRLAAALDADDVEGVALATGATVDRVATLSWDPARDDLRARVERRLDNLVIGETEGPAEPGPATGAALLARVRSTKLGILSWPPAARSLQQRAAFARRVTASGEPERSAHRKGGQTAPASGGAADPAGEWPDLSDGGLLASLEEWLSPLLGKASGRADLEAVDMTGVLRRRLGHRVTVLDRVAPPGITLAGGRSVPVDYEGDRPAAEVRVQDAFGTTTHPTVGGIPVVLSLLSPAGRPIQVTADLPGFWTGSWADVRKDMAGRYPKHSWPVDPSSAT